MKAGRSMRKIVRIDEAKCDGCGLCASACAEGAIRIVDGKAKLVSETYCDGLGACLGECPRGAIAIEERAAKPFDEAAVEKHLGHKPAQRQEAPAPKPAPALACGCPGMAVKAIARPAKPAAAISVESRLQNWPVQIKLVPPTAPYLKGARLLICADCVPFAFADFHRRFVDGRVVLVGCPKLDDGQFYVDKLADLFARSGVASVEVVHMEVPCCHGLLSIVGEALEKSKVDVPATAIMVGIDGEIRSERELAAK